MDNTVKNITSLPSSTSVLAFVLMAPAELSCLKSELLSLEKLIHELLHSRSQITSCLRLAGMAGDWLPPAPELSLRDMIPSASWTMGLDEDGPPLALVRVILLVLGCGEWWCGYWTIFSLRKRTSPSSSTTNSPDASPSRKRYQVTPSVAHSVAPSISPSPPLLAVAAVAETGTFNWH
eukprot:superscaffoldBa00000514_g5332